MSDPTLTEVQFEQSRIDAMYLQLDRARIESAVALRTAQGGSAAGPPATRTERDAFVRMYSARVRQLDSVEQRLCFGRLDLDDGLARYVGRIGLSDDDHVELLIDWRAPAAEPFYRATAAHPDGVLRRRQITTSGRQVTALQDEVLDLVGFQANGVGGSHVVLGEGALFASLDAERTGRMRDIVATIQADQDQIIRAPLAGVLVVQGGPGTGKTAVALHRAAYLLYANRDRIARSGVLVIGPNRTFLRYIDQVLPGLGEAEALVLATPGELYPGVTATVTDPSRLASLKGDLRMAQVVSRAVRARERVLREPRRLRVGGTEITLGPREVREAREHARRSRQPHNQARGQFVRELLRSLSRQLAAARNHEMDPELRSELIGELRDSVDVRREVNWCWAPITPERLIRDLFALPERLIEATEGLLSGSERQLLRRERTAPWTVDDVALLDEAAELLGFDDTADLGVAAAAASSRAAEIAYARDVQGTFGGQGFINAEDLATRYAGVSDLGSVAERAVEDRSWAYGHIVVDEAQELSPMMWRMVLRRCPSRSMTVVGDVAQTGSAAGASSWRSVLTPHLGDRWQESQLRVNYRTPEQLMDLAASVVKAGGSTIEPPRSARRGRYEPAYMRVRSDSADLFESDPLTAATMRALAVELRTVGTGTVAVIAPPQVVQALRVSTAAVAAADISRVSVLNPNEAKGLEFDAAVVVEPAAILRSARGLNDLYVALTRSTQRLHIVHAEQLPPGMPTTPRDPTRDQTRDRPRGTAA